VSSARVDDHTVRLTWRDRPLDLEYAWVGDPASRIPVVVFLHEGLGSVAMWKDFPERLCVEAGCRGLVYSRYGYGRSTPKPTDERWDTDYLHRQATETLPPFLSALGVRLGRRAAIAVAREDEAGEAVAIAERAREVAPHRDRAEPFVQEHDDVARPWRRADPLVLET